MQLYSVPIIQQDLRHEETIIQAVNALEHLYNIINDVFDRIEARIESNTNRMNNFKERIGSANNKIASLVGKNKAINIFSPNKFPGVEVFQDAEMIFNAVNLPLNSIDKNYDVVSSLDPTHHKNVHEKLQFYHVKTKSDPKLKINQHLSSPVGLGKPISTIDSVNALLLFNTYQNPFENYSILERIEEITRHQVDISATGEQIDAAPHSIWNRQTLNNKFLDNLLYVPGAIDAPALDVPFDLPDLPGIAEDITFVSSNDTEQGIGPSKSKIQATDALNLPVLPNIEDIAVEAIEQSLAVVVPPPVPQKIRDEQKATIISTTAVAPPPPPPPPPMLLAQSAASETKLSSPEDAKLSSVKPAAQSADSQRSNLMEAIRQAGGKSKLRAAAEIEPNATSSIDQRRPQSNELATVGDLMADLHIKLSMRRKGISGANNGNNVMDRVSALIPPPPVPNKSTATEPSDDDWEE